MACAVDTHPKCVDVDAFDPRPTAADALSAPPKCVDVGAFAPKEPAVKLFRTVAYKLFRPGQPSADTPEPPEVTVFFEAADHVAAPAQVLRLLALTWCCEPSDIEFYNLWTEPELQLQSGLADAWGDVRLLVNGHFHGPLFCDRKRTQLLCRPITAQRLMTAQDQVDAYLAQLHEQVASIPMPPLSMRMQYPPQPLTTRRADDRQAQGARP